MILEKSRKIGQWRIDTQADIARMNQVTVGYTFEGITKMAQSYMVNGKFVCPQLPPSCFGLATSYQLTAEDVERGVLAYGEDFTHTVGETIDGGIYTVSNKPRAKRKLVGDAKQAAEQYDTCILGGKPGSSARIEALQAFYGELSQDSQLLSPEFNISPFSADMAELVSKSAIGKVWEEFDRKEAENVA
jgi:hypothetical protein